MANDASQPRRVTYAPLDRCVACGYSLRGTTDLRCPECGTDYEEELVLIGDPIDRTRPRIHGRNRLASPIVQVVLSGLGLAVLTWAVLGQTSLSSDARLIASGISGIVVAVMTLNETRKLHGAVDDEGAYDPNRFHAAILRVRPSGFAMRTGYGEFRFKPWKQNCQIRLRVNRRGDRLRLSIYRVCGGITLWRVTGMRVDIHTLDVEALREALRAHSTVVDERSPRVWDDD